MQGFVLLLLVIGGVMFNMDGSVFIYFYILSSYLPVLFLANVIIKKLMQKEDGNVGFKEFVMQSLISHGAKLSLIIESTFDRFYIMQTQDNSNLAFYSVAQNLSGLITTAIQLPLNSTILPYLNNTKEKERWTVTFKLYIKIQFSLAIFTVIGLLFSDFIVISLYGEEYQKANFVLKVLMVAVCLRMPVICYSYYFRSIQKTHKMLKISLITMPTNIALCVYLIPIYGIEGGAYASLVSYCLFNAMSSVKFFAYRNELGVR
ncbi:hypothetical protein A140_03345 [Vibrio crassostreae 9ZC88]|nr:hypothetical protein A140_03345 [Vibrio crassostreae 9ZC88]